MNSKLKELVFDKFYWLAIYLVAYLAYQSAGFWDILAKGH